MILEVCVDSLESAQNAVDGGADRLELCSALSEAGLTPSIGLFNAVKKIIQNTPTKLFCMIRLRGGNFNFTFDEIEGMCEDVKYFKSNEADGIVFGALDQNFEIDIESCKKILSAWGTEKPATFHRAFDETKVEDLKKNLEIISELGFKRLLTSGFESSAEKGIENLKKVSKVAKELNLIVMPGAGVNSRNAKFILREVKCNEIHASARIERNIATKLSLGGENVMICDRGKVEDIKRVMKNFE